MLPGETPVSRKSYSMGHALVRKRAALASLYLHNGALLPVDHIQK